jgi:hypothetical protein
LYNEYFELKYFCIVEINEEGDVAIQVQMTANNILSIVQNPIMGQMRKSFANINTYVHKGQNVVSSKAFNRKDANTDSQKAHRASFKLIGDAWVWVCPFAENGLLNRPQSQSTYNVFMALNLPGAIDSSGEVPVIDFTKLQIASGTLPAVEVISTSVADSVLTVNYDSLIEFPRVDASDVITVLVKTLRGAVYFTRQPRGTAFEGTLLVQMRNVTVADIECAYLFVTTADGKKASNSVFVEVV